MYLDIISSKYTKEIESLLHECELKLYEINIVNDFESLVLQILVENLDVAKKHINFDSLIGANEKISVFLDNIIDLNEPYILEVSSAGVERTVKEEVVLKNNINEYFYLEVYKPVEGADDFLATLIDCKDNEFLFSFFLKGKPKKIKLLWTDIKFIRFAVKF